MREEHIKRLVESDDPVKEVWQILVEIWEIAKIEEKVLDKLKKSPKFG